MCDPYLGYKVNNKVDMWQLGGVIFTLMFFRHPFVDSSKMGIINASYFWPQQNQYSKKLENLVRNLLTPNPDLRPSSMDINNVLNSWHNMETIELNSMAQEIKEEHQRRTGVSQQSQKHIIKTKGDLSPKTEMDDFDFSGLNKIAKKPQIIQKEKPLTTVEPEFHFDFGQVNCHEVAKQAQE